MKALLLSLLILGVSLFPSVQADVCNGKCGISVSAVIGSFILLIVVMVIVYLLKDYVLGQKEGKEYGGVGRGDHGGFWSFPTW